MRTGGRLGRFRRLWLLALVSVRLLATPASAWAQDPSTIDSVPELLRLSREFSDRVDDAHPESLAQSHAERSLACAQRALAKDPSNAKAHLSVAVGYGKLTDFVSSKQKLEYSKRLHDEVLKSIALDPNDDHAWHLLGRWNSGMANINPVLRTMAGLIYGKLPPASNQEALRCLKKARDLAPQRLMHRSELARIYTTMGQTELALGEWKVVLTLPAVDRGDAKDKTEAKAALE